MAVLNCGARLFWYDRAGQTRKVSAIKSTQF